MPESIHDRILRDRKHTQKLPQRLRTYRRYARGEQKGTISHEQRMVLGVLIGHDFSDNLCDTIIDAAASREELTGFDVDSNTAVKDWLDRWYIKNAVSDLQYDVHYSKSRDGNHAIMLSWEASKNPRRDGEPGRVTIHQEDWWDGESGMFVAYEDDDVTYAYAVKEFHAWIGADNPIERKRRTVYYADRIERYILVGSGWQPFMLPDDHGVWPMPWTRSDGSPLGIPVVHFANGRFAARPYGVSDLSGGIIGLQDEVNDFQRDITAAGRMTAYQMYWMTGIDLSTEKMNVGPGKILWTGNPAGRVGALQAGDLSQLIAGHLTKVSTISRNSRTPIHIITGQDWPSGEALIRAETPLVDRVQRQIKTDVPAWAMTAHRSTEIANAFGRVGLDENAMITPAFSPPERRDALTLAQIEIEKIQGLILLHDLGFSRREIMRRYGLTEKQIDAMEKERQDEAAMDGLIFSATQAPAQQQQQQQQQQNPQNPPAKGGQGQ